MRVVALCAGMLLAAGGAHAGFISTQRDVVPGEWTSDYDGAMAYANANNIPMIVFWANAGCSNCEKIEKEMNKPLFQTWADELNVLMVFVESNTTVKKWIKDNARTKITKYPFMAVYWPKNAQGETVLEGFSAYKGGMSDYGANSNDSNIVQIMDAVEYLLAGWESSGVSPSPAPQSYTVKFVVDTTKGTASGSLTQTVAKGNAATAPTVKAKSGWSFDGWDKSFGNVTSDLTVTAKFSAEDVDPDPVYYTVNFVVDESKGTVSGSLSQTVAKNKGAVAPTVVAKEGWKFDGWDKSFNKVTSDLTVTAKFVVPAEREEIDPAVLFKKSQKLEAIAYMDGNLFGKALITLGKYNKKKDNLKITFKITSFGGKSYSKSVYATPDEYGDILGVDVAIKSPIGEMVFDIINDEDGFAVEGSGESCSVEAGDVTLGGTLENKEMFFSADFGELEPEKDTYEFIVDPPMYAQAEVKRGKTLSFGSTPSIKYKKYKEDGETWYDLAEWDEERYPNTNGIKLTYKTATGAFSGSFKIYASNESDVDFGKKPTLKKYTAKFSGYVVDGVGVGTVSVKIGRKTYSGTCALE